MIWLFAIAAVVFLTVAVGAFIGGQELVALFALATSLLSAYGFIYTRRRNLRN